jgi:methylmalonyl-CoA/ethylmalonyl-CoA epimerase
VRLDPSESHELDHVAIGLPLIADALPFLVGELGGEKHDDGPGAGFRWVQWRFAGGGVIEVLEPAGEPGGFLHRFLERRGPGIHHVTFKVSSLERAADRARAAGYEIVGWFDADPTWKECFLHPKQAQGIVVQLAESNPGLATGEAIAWPHVTLPVAPAAHPEPVRLVGLRVSAREATGARRQWHGALGGEIRELGTDRLAFHWPRSPLHIEVVIRPDAEEGPLQIELATGRSWPEGGIEALGTRFVCVA